MNRFFVSMIAAAVMSAGAAEVFSDFGATPENRKAMLNAQWVKFSPDGGPEQAYSLETAGNVMPDIPLEAAAVAGKTVTFSGMLRGEGIEPKDPRFGGVVFLIHYKLDGKSRFAGAVPEALKKGTIGWTAHSVTEKIPDGATDIRLRFGLQQSAGRAFFSKLAVKTEETR